MMWPGIGRTGLAVVGLSCELEQLASTNAWTLAHYLLISNKKGMLDPPCLSVALPWYENLMSQYRRFSTVAVQRPPLLGRCRLRHHSAESPIAQLCFRCDTSGNGSFLNKLDVLDLFRVNELQIRYGCSSSAEFKRVTRAGTYLGIDSREMPESKNQGSLVQESAPPENGAGDASETPYNWRRGVFFNATIVGLAAFAAPGLWNAMQSVGAGGQQTPYLVM